jgi:hypothetical protein
LAWLSEGLHGYIRGCYITWSMDLPFFGMAGTNNDINIYSPPLSSIF